MPPTCPFCPPPSDRLFHGTALISALWDAYPVSPGHALLIPRRHIATWFDATPDEQHALTDAIALVKAEIEKTHRPDGYNIGINVGEAAGQTVFHLHVHVIPRYAGDVENPRGGVRHVLPAKADYLADAPPPAARLLAVDIDPLLPHLEDHIGRATQVDVAIAFVNTWALLHLKPHLEELLDRGGSLRFLTGDYQDWNDPDALTHLVDLQGPGAGIRIYESTSERSFHPKAWIFRHRDGTRAALIGSSNLTRKALQTGVEWNYRALSQTDHAGLAEIHTRFEALFNDPATKPLTHAWIDEYRRRRGTPQLTEAPELEPTEPATPTPVQRAALQALAETRADGAKRGLVVLATGLGKTFLAAFDSVAAGFERVLFIAHRDEILTQARDTFHRVKLGARLGLYTGKEKTPGAEALFASIQTLSNPAHLDRFGREEFDYVVIDEFHHAAARSYQRVLAHFRPKFLLGLTATPDRTDGKDLLALCDDNLVYQCDLAQGIEDDQLAPFRYFGVPDDVDYDNIPWRSTKFDTEALTTAVATQVRADNALEQLRTRGGERALGFCCSIAHADFMAEHFQSAGLRAVAVHTGEKTAPRAKSLEDLEAGRLDIVFAVDLFNEGVDVPLVDTVLMLRPTESKILWLQQLGRGLRKHADKPHLSVIDYIGNHRVFLTKIQALFGIDSGDIETLQERVLALRRAGGHPEDAQIPRGCEVTYELEAIALLEKLARIPADELKLLRIYERHKAQHGERPTAVQMVRDGAKPRWAKSRHGSWHAFVDDMGDLSEPASQAVQRTTDFREALEKTEMTKSYKMLVILAMLDAGRFPGQIEVRDLAERVRARALERRAITREFGEATLKSLDALEKDLRKNPIKAWAGAKGTNGRPYFELTGTTFRTALPDELASEPMFPEIVREIAEWRLDEHLRNKNDKDAWLPQLLDDDGNPVDATFRVEEGDAGLVVVFDSRGGTRGTEAARNTEYAAGLRLVLQRLRQARARITRAEADTTTTRSLPAEERLLRVPGGFPMTIGDPDETRRVLQNAAKRVGQAPGAKGGNDTKRLVLWIDADEGMSVEELDQRLAKPES